jgi:hypothetical protein
MKAKRIKYYDWVDVEAELCKTMGIHVDNFRDYHRVVYPDFDTKFKNTDNSPYYDCWHVWLDYWGEKLHNDSYNLVIFAHPDQDEEWDYLKNDAIKKRGEWVIPLMDAIRKLAKDFGTDDGYLIKMLMWHSW